MALDSAGGLANATRRFFFLATIAASIAGCVGKLAGKPVRLRFVMKDADLYSIQFTSKQPVRR